MKDFYHYYQSAFDLLLDRQSTQMSWTNSLTPKQFDRTV